ncbi:hypothetical protein K435DRAFT_962911 [Dendrothele bispora CBS 962.96]|uniref:Uncharacterized protein n=1 Tax=Dendrothele bispora (strain CBS 962.96) TaxID=1314807 RepID=A0A4S8MJ94_DENBC|nr:hypothetical protein K435DRAFT_962911 [Dendrothele bispora CBS 962.96]
MPQVSFMMKLIPDSPYQIVTLAIHVLQKYESVSEKNSEPPLHTPKPRRQSSVFKCCIWIFGLIALVISGFIGYFCYLFLTELHRRLAYPHSYLHQNQSLSEVSNRSLVVQPLVGQEQTFDIAVSVWIRALQAKEEEWRTGLGGPSTDSESESDQYKPLQFFQNYNEANKKLTINLGDEDEFLHGEKRVLYHPLYSDIVFRGLRPSDKSVMTSINFTIPTQKFREPKLRASDLRASMLLIPTSPSLMDSVVNYSSWIPEELRSKSAPERTWPFPMGSKYMGEKTITDLALESFAVSVPLVQFHTIPSRCPSVVNDTKSDSGDDFELGVVMDVNGNFNFTKIAGKLKLKDAAKTEKHPHIVTWSQIRLIDENHIMNLEAYDKAHEELKRTSCGQDLKANQPIKPLHRLCEDLYLKTGPLKTKFQLEIEDTDGGKHTEWAYSPYLTTFPHAEGPLDLIPVPVDREDCTDKDVLNANGTSTFNHTDADSMDVTWHLSFSGRSPLKAVLGGTLSPPSTVNHSQSDFDKVDAQDTRELWNGLHGVSKPNAHPRRRILLKTVEVLFAFTVSLLDAIYWYTRNSTVFISVPGTLLLVAADILSSIANWIDDELIYVSISFAIIGTPVVFFHLRTALRIELEWRGWIPTLRRVHPSHRERVSHRLDMTLDWYPRLASICFLFVVFFFIPKSYKTLISPLHPPQPPNTDSKRLDQYINIGNCIAESLGVTGSLSQLILNHKSKHFSGMYKSQAFLVSLGGFMWLMSFVPALVGRPQTRPRLTFDPVVQILISFAMAYQALTLPAVEPIGPDEDEE